MLLTGWRLGEINSRQEVVHDVWIVPQQDSPHVTDNLAQQAWDHATQESPRFVSNSEEDLGDQNEQKDDHVDGVAGHTGSVENGLPGFRTGWSASDGTVLFGHADGGLVVGVLKSIVDECSASDVPLLLEMIRDIVIVWGVCLTHCGAI